MAASTSTPADASANAKRLLTQLLLFVPIIVTDARSCCAVAVFVAVAPVAEIRGSVNVVVTAAIVVEVMSVMVDAVAMPVVVVTTSVEIDDDDNDDDDDDADDDDDMSMFGSSASVWRVLTRNRIVDNFVSVGGSVFSGGFCGEFESARFVSTMGDKVTNDDCWVCRSFESL